MRKAREVREYVEDCILRINQSVKPSYVLMWLCWSLLGVALLSAVIADRIIGIVLVWITMACAMVIHHYGWWEVISRLFGVANGRRAVSVLHQPLKKNETPHIAKAAIQEPGWCLITKHEETSFDKIVHTLCATEGFTTKWQ